MLEVEVKKYDFTPVALSGIAFVTDSVLKVLSVCSDCLCLAHTMKLVGFCLNQQGSYIFFERCNRLLTSALGRLEDRGKDSRS